MGEGDQLRRRCEVCSIAVLALVNPVGLEGRQVDDPAAPRAPVEATVDRLSFLAGCWAGRMGTLDMREQWSEAEGGVMLGTTRFFRQGELVDFEFGMFIEDGAGVTMWPYPKGERSQRGFPLVSTEGEFVFENLEHDFPVRIVYARDGDDGLSPRIEGHDGTGPAWTLTRVPCPDGPF